MYRILPACRGCEQCGRCHVAKEAGCLGAAVVGDATDAGGGDDEQEFVASQAEPRGPAPADERERAGVAAAEPVQADRAAAARAEPAGQLPGGMTRPFPRLLGRFQMPSGDRWRNEGGRHEDDAAAVGEVAAGLPLELANGVQAHRHLVVERDCAGLDAGVVGELARHRVAEPGVLQLPGRLVQRDGGDAEGHFVACVHEGSCRVGRQAPLSTKGGQQGAGLWRSAAAGASEKSAAKTACRAEMRCGSRRTISGSGGASLPLQCGFSPARGL